NEDQLVAHNAFIDTDQVWALIRIMSTLGERSMRRPAPGYTAPVLCSATDDLLDPSQLDVISRHARLRDQRVRPGDAATPARTEGLDGGGGCRPRVDEREHRHLDRQRC